MGIVTVAVVANRLYGEVWDYSVRPSAEGWEALSTIMVYTEEGATVETVAYERGTFPLAVGTAAEMALECVYDLREELRGNGEDPKLVTVSHRDVL